MPKIDYSKLPYPERASTRGHSVKNSSSYMPRTGKIPDGDYKDFYDYDTTGMKLAVAGGRERPDSPLSLQEDKA